MALYDFSCVDPVCGAVTELNVPMAQCTEVQVCGDCGGPAERIFDYLSQGVIWKAAGSTRTFRDPKMPKLPPINPGHESLTMGKLGLTEPGDAERLGL